VTAANRRLLHLTRQPSTTDWGFSCRRLINEFEEQGYDVQVRWAFTPDIAKLAATDPQYKNDMFDEDFFRAFEPDLIMVEGGPWSDPQQGTWRMPQDLAVEFVDNGGVLIALHANSRFQYEEVVKDLPFFGGAAPEDGRILQIRDEVSYSESDGRIVAHPDRMVIDASLSPALEGIDAIHAWGPNTLEPRGRIAGSAEPTARTLYADIWQDAPYPSPFAFVRRHGFGYAALFAATVADDDVVSQHPANSQWIHQLAEVLIDESHSNQRYVSEVAVTNESIEPQVEDLVSSREGFNLEFKETARWDVREQKTGKHIQATIAKTIAGFMNAEGGTLLIGVRDDGTIAGLDPDYETLRKKSSDDFELFLRQLIENSLTGPANTGVAITFPLVEGVEICRVKTMRAPDAVFLKDKKEARSRFFVHEGNQTRELMGEDALKYQRRHWPSS